MMISLFMRSYPPDFEWLRYSILSIQKNLIGITEKVLVIPDICIDIPDYLSLFFDRIYTVKETHEGYIQQQIDKVRAYKYCKNDYILFSDSDCIYYEPFDANCRIEENRIVLPKTRYSKLPKDPQVWKRITYLATGILPKYEYMRCFPIVHHKTVLEYLDTNERYNSYLTIAENGKLSEFNALGIVAETIFPELYKFIDTTKSNRQIPKAKQYWSWGGIDAQILNELETL